MSVFWLVSLGLLEDGFDTTSTMQISGSGWISMKVLLNDWTVLHLLETGNVCVKLQTASTRPTMAHCLSRGISGVKNNIFSCSLVSPPNFGLKEKNATNSVGLTLSGEGEGVLPPNLLPNRLFIKYGNFIRNFWIYPFEPEIYLGRDFMRKGT